MSISIKIDELLEDVAKREGCHASDIQWYSWPQTFGSTAGPSGGIGGQQITSFQVIAFDPPIGRKQKFCAGRWKEWSGNYQEKW